ncbi:type I-E CRISPR-associated protein Cse2/CasB [Saccharopolyspora sp. ID03-671]|uniref:type I-E CRISPR-associated protein Cse2/CasB n=1 Tax=Saccharopolyspora sp. ID03-671 TaxID=3073066 RepID=UPI00324E67E7
MTISDLAPVAQRRREFIDHLQLLAWNLTSGRPHLVSEARRTLAQLRRSITEHRHEHDALALVFEHQPPRAEEQAWLTIAGLFALAPQTGGSRLPLGAALQQLDRQRASGTAQKRLRQLLAADAHSLPQHLRSALRLLANDGITVNFHALLDDLVILLHPVHDENKTRDVQWRWARDFHRKTSTNNTPASQETDQ